METILIKLSKRYLMQNKTYILDTNVYGELLIEEKSEELIKEIENDKSLYIYGVDIIEGELHDVPSDKKIKGDIFRSVVLSTYKSLIDEELILSPLAKYLANEYFKRYIGLRKSGRYYKIIKNKEIKYKEEDLKIDFEIIALASIKNIDIVISADKRTMLSKLATETYNIINKINGLKTPNLIDYFKFKRRYIK